MRQRFLNDEKKTTVPSFDNDAVRDILARATEIEAQRQEEKLTAAQVEALGQELGMSPDAVRQALQERIGQASSVQTNTVNSHALPVVTGRDVRACAKTTAIYSVIALVLLVTMNALRDADSPLLVPVIASAVAYLLVGPFYLAFRHGWKQKDWRQGLLFGAVLTPMILTAMIMSVQISLRLGYHDARLEPSLFLTMMITACVSGATGGIVGKGWQKRKAAMER